MNTGKFGLGSDRKIDNNDFNEAFQTNAVKNEPQEIYCNQSSDAADSKDHKHNTDCYHQEQNEEKLDVKNLNPKDTNIFESSSTSTFNSVEIKHEDIDILYEDIKRETSEEKSSKDLGLLSLEVQDETISGDEVAKELNSSAALWRLSPSPKENKYKNNNCKFCSHLSLTDKKSHCQSCSKSFSRIYHLEIHKRGHAGEKPVNCKMCSKAFTTSGNLRSHERIHSGVKFHCKICSRSFTQMSHLKTHKMTPTGEKPFHCKTCSKSFSQKIQLTVHERNHSGEKPFHCNTCSKSFRRSDTLKVHERSHTGKKQFHCQFCSKRFSRMYTLEVHERIHTGEKPFHCKICSKSFRRKDNLRGHEREHTGKNHFNAKCVLILSPLLVF